MIFPKLKKPSPAFVTLLIIPWSKNTFVIVVFILSLADNYYVFCGQPFYIFTKCEAEAFHWLQSRVEM